VAGPVEEISFLGHPVAYIAPSVYGHPQVSVHSFIVLTLGLMMSVMYMYPSLFV